MDNVSKALRYHSPYLPWSLELIQILYPGLHLGHEYVPEILQCLRVKTMSNRSSKQALYAA